MLINNPDQKKEKKKYSKKIQYRFGTCSKDCYGSCVFEGEWNDYAPERKLITINPIKDHPFTQGMFCSKHNQRMDLIYHPKRIKSPLIRSKPKGQNKFDQLSLKSALIKIAEKINIIIKKFSSTSILGAFYSGNSGLLSQYSPLRFFRKIGATITSGGICNEGGCAGLNTLFNTHSTTNPLQLKNPNTQLIVVWGCNLSETNNHAYKLVKQTLKKGTKLLVVDSRCTTIAKEAHCYLQPYPGTDHLVTKLIIHDLITRKSFDEDFLIKHVDGYNSIISEVDKVNKVDLISQTGINAKKLQNFVDYLIEFRHNTIFNIGYGIQKEYYGGRIVRAIALIQIVLGNIGKSGTGIIYSQSDFMKPIIQPLLNYITQNKSSKSLKEIPLIKLGTELASGKYKMLFIYNFNPVSSLPNQNQLKEALSRKDLFIVIHELFLNETTKYADLVIPAKFDIETNDFFSPYYFPSISINQAGLCPYPNCISNYEFFQLLAWELGWNKENMFLESEKAIYQHCLQLLPEKIRLDIDKDGYHALFNSQDIPFEDMKFPTLNGKINASGPHFNFKKNFLNSRLLRKRNEFFLITPSHPKYLHSQLSQINQNQLDDFNKVFLNPEDIDTLGLKLGNEVLVSNEFGSTKYLLEKSNALKPNMALIYSGLSSSIGDNPNANIFTPDKPEEMGFSGAYNSAIVKILPLKN